MISRRIDDFTGFIIDNKKKYPFYAAKKRFHFVSEGAGIFAEAIRETIHCDNEFIYGYTTDGYQVALNTGRDELILSPNYVLKPRVFFVSKTNLGRVDMTKFSSVQFRGGTLNNLFENKIIAASFDEKKNVYIRKYARFIQEYDLKIGEEKCQMRIFSMPSESIPKNMDLCVRFEFENNIKIIYVQRLLDILVDLCQLMTNRQNVGFDSVELYVRDSFSKKERNISEGIVNYTYNSFTTKKYTKNILFEHIGEKLVDIIQLIDEDKERKEKYTFDFLPANDADMFVVTNDKIKNICSSLECEMSFIKDWNSVEDNALKELIENVKDVIKEHRKSENKCDDKTYDNIFSSIAHWDMPSSVKMYILYKRHDSYMTYFESRWEKSCTEEDIKEFVKYRNDVTHGRYRSLEPDIVGTAFVLMGLAYCCFWERMGIDATVLSSLVKEGRIL